MGTLMALLGGAGIGAGAYALEGVDLAPQWKAAIAALGGGGIGLLVSGWSPEAGAGIAGGGAAVATKQLLDMYMAGGSDTSGLGRIPGYAYKKFGPTPTRPHYYHMPHPAYAQLDAVQADLGAVQANLGAYGAHLV